MNDSLKKHAASLVHVLFVEKCGAEHLRKGAVVGITNNEASDVAEAGRERASPAVMKKAESFTI